VTFEQILLLYLYNNKKVSLNLFGTIVMEGSIPEPELIRKEKVMAVDGLKFTFDPNVTTDEEFIKFYAFEKGRILSLSTSDIEVQLSMARQIVNIGNPFDIPGVGKIVKMDNGKLTILPGFYTIPPESGSGRPAPLRERVQAAALPKGEGNKDGSRSMLNIKFGTVLGIGGVLAGIAILIWAFIKFGLPLFQNNDNATVDQAIPSVDSVAVAPPTNINLTDTTGAGNNTAADMFIDSTVLLQWKAYISKTNQKNFAEERFNRYKGYGHNVVLESPDSTQFLIYIPMQSAIKDTARKRDSLAKFFAFPVRLEKIANP
jgi:hypothetical protein